MAKIGVSVIIICEEENSFLKEALSYYVDLDHPSYEILVFSTRPIKIKQSGVRFINDPKTKNKPAEKRDLALKYAQGEILAFIDDDAYPSPEWLKEGLKHFEDRSVAAVGGPGINPPGAGLMERASGWVSASPLGGFGQTHRFVPQKRRQIDDHPSMNFLVRRSDFKKVGGFDSDFYPGEDTKLCLDLVKKLEKKIIYEPKALVYHHKRPLFKKHLLQNGRFGLHRGHFARTLPATSRRWHYFVPAIFLIGLLGGAVLFFPFWPDWFFLHFLRLVYLIVLGLYVILLILNSLWVLAKSKSPIVAFLIVPGVFFTHVWYGFQFIRGYLSPALKDDYGRA